MIFRERAEHWLREPLVHFLVAGAAIFVVFAWRGSETDVGDRRIVVDEERVQRLASIWTQTWQRPPSAQELDGLIRDYIKEEIYYREALRLELDRDDMVVRRRLRSKMESLATSQTETAVPDEAQLQAWLDRHPAQYASDPVFSLDQVYVATAGGDEAATAKAKTLLGALREGANPVGLGDAISLPRKMEGAGGSEIDRQFGESFATTLKSLPVGRWSGPIASGFGLHLVRVRSVEAPYRPKLANVRQAVENDWREATRLARENRAYQALLDGYRIEIERPR